MHFHGYGPAWKGGFAYSNRLRPPLVKVRYATVPTGGECRSSVLAVSITEKGAMRRNAEMPFNRINGRHIALDNAFNRIVRYQVAASRKEADAVVAALPFIVSNGLDSELGICKEAHRYDLDTKRAYCFQLDGDRLHIWIWNEVDSYVEAGNLL